MSPGITYIFSLTYKYSLTAKSSAAISIKTNTLPYNGTLTLDKLSGNSLSDIFKADMSGWVSDNIPLTYLFSAYYGTSSQEYLISGAQSSNYLLTYYPGGTINLIGYCYDSLGSRSEISATLSVTSLKDPNNLAINLQGLQVSVDSTNVYSIIPEINACAIEFGYGYIDPQVIITYKTGLISLVNQTKNLADSLYPNINSIYLYYGLIGNMETIIGNSISSDIINSIIEIFNSINYTRLEMYQEIYPIANSGISVTSPQYVLRQVETDNLATLMANIINTISDSQYSSAHINEISTMINNLNIVLSLGSSITESSRILDLNSIQMVTSKSLLQSIENTNITISEGVSVAVPVNLSSTVNSTQVSLVTALINSNPFTSTVAVLNQYLYVELKDLSTGNALNVESLDNPFTLSFNISKSDFIDIYNKITSTQGNSVQVWPECTY